MKFKQTIRTAILYVTTVVLVGGVPMTTFADHSEACIAAGHKGKKWVVDPATGKCVKVSAQATTPSSDAASDSEGSTPATTTPPAGTSTPSSNTPATTPTSQSQSPTTATATSTPASTPTNTNSVTGNTNAASNTTANNNNSVTTGVNAGSTSGNATVHGNESQGSAGTGDASADTTVVNSVHSTVDGGTTGVAHFTANINGDVTGDITLGPTIDSATATNNTNISSNTNVNNKTGLTNDISLTANSGDATVRGNQSQGNATTGNANTVADVLNLINTIIAANKSFVGTINIYGNLNGDILISPEFIPQLLASNAGSATNVNVNMPLATNVNDDQTIVNNVKLNATTGSAAVNGNSTAGSATTGTALTNLTILNLTGHQVNAANSLLVFVNVLGKWVGMIVDAPGATAAAFGSGLVSDTTLVGQTNINNTAGITNNINLASQSGNALVAGNSSTGSAASGNATASANIANISTSTFNLTGWFGILYINVFGTWLGSFGVDTVNGEVVPLSGAAAAAPGPASPSAPAMRFGFVPHAPSHNANAAVTRAVQNGGGGLGGGVDSPNGVTPTVQAVLTNADGPMAPTAGGDGDGTQLTPVTSQYKKTVDPLAIFMIIGGSLTAFAPMSLGVLRRRKDLLATLRARV
jgi:hypothetical protein